LQPPTILLSLLPLLCLPTERELTPNQIKSAAAETGVRMLKLDKIPGYSGPQGPVVLVIMDGVGIGSGDAGDMVAKASKPHLDWLAAHTVTSQLKAHGTAVGMPDDGDMGNSEVGHNAIGAGRVFAQGARLVNEAIASGAWFDGATWNELMANVLEHNSTLHLIGLLSDGNVHSHITQLEALLDEAGRAGVHKLRLHVLLDGRDVPPTSALDYVDRIEAKLAALCQQQQADFRIGSGGGRMQITMDRYNADWPMIARGWDTHVRGVGPGYPSARAAIEAARAAKPGVIDQDLPPFVIQENGASIGKIMDGDSVILFNFRGDRAIEWSRAFDEEELTEFDRGPKPQVVFAGMMQYDGDLQIPRKFLVTPPAIDRTLGEYLANNGISQFAISETQKYGHVTYFFNGNRSGKFSDQLETYVEIPSDRVSFDLRPWMKAAEITDEAVKAIESGKHQFIRINYPNGDMVGHTGDLLAVEISVEAVDLGIGRLMKAVAAAQGILVVTADHGNADEMYEVNKQTGELKLDSAGHPKSKTAHTLNPVPFHVYDPANVSKARLSNHTNVGITSLAATCLRLLGYEPPALYDPSIVDVG
jgi:2,3-bisphosphoglycerate-independent phosphoglycerate mutase